MRIKVELEVGRPPRRTVGLLLALLLILVPTVALADHQFPDVPNSHPFHSQIGAIANAGIAAGFSDGGFHPADPVTRQAMAAFLERGLGRITRRDSGITDVPALSVGANVQTSPYVTVRTLAITVPGAESDLGPTQFVYVTGKIVLRTSMDASEGCPCEFGGFVEHVSSGFQDAWQYQTFGSSTATPFAYSFTVDGLFGAEPGPEQYLLRVFLNNRANVVPAATYEIDPSSSINVFNIPFGTTF